ncbi:MAG: cobalt-precorrin-6A reductase [Rhizobiaceae bacterium]
MAKILILGGTTEARRLAALLAQWRGRDIVLSLAGRTENPVAQPVPVRIGGFGGAEGLATYLESEGIALLVDATHPYAARISANAAQAARLAGVPMLALRRPGWVPVEGDRWTDVADVADAVRALGAASRRVFLALGRNEVKGFEAARQHAYVVRSVDPIRPPLGLPDVTYLIGRGPFAEAGELDLLRREKIEAIVCKNSGGTATYGKLAAARRLGIPVFMLKRPALPDVPGAETVEVVAAMADHALAPLEKRGE